MTRDGAARLLAPRALLVALYHPEHFPLPRFPLGISDLARATRATLLGQVELMDLQPGWTLDDVLTRGAAAEPDIVGVSATFEQHDLMTELLDHLTTLHRPPMLAAGGSLTIRNERLLLERYPQLLIARGAGEPPSRTSWHCDTGTSRSTKSTASTTTTPTPTAPTTRAPSRAARAAAPAKTRVARTGTARP
ncbi:hypothetical protein OHR68_19900 [Spirillospora sp. NBC_00431]